MTIDEAIKFCEEGSKSIWNDRLTTSGRAWQQMAEWLKELKTYREAPDVVARGMIKECFDSFSKDTDATAIDCINRSEIVTSMPCEDVISRQATVESLAKVADFLNDRKSGLGYPYIMAALFIQDNKDEFPSVTPQQNMGQWLIKRIDNYDHAICSVCGDDSYLSPEWDALELYKYCPSCGAKMENEGSK